MNTEDFDFEEIEQIHQQEVREEAAAIPEIEDGLAELEDLAQEMEDRGEPDEAETEMTDIAYPEVRSVQDVRDAVDEVIAENPTRIDMSLIPMGMTTADYIAHYQATGTLLTQSTGVSGTYTATGVDTTDATNAEAPTLLSPSDMDFEEVEKKEVPEEPPLSSEEIARIKAERKLYHAGQLKQKREIRVRDIAIDKNDLVITFTDGNHSFYHLDIEGSHPMTQPPVRDSERSSTRRRRTNVSTGNISNSLIFDKNMNRLILRKNSLEKTDRRDGTRIYQSQTYMSSEGGSGIEMRFVIIDKDAFINSKGKMWNIRYRSQVPYHRIIETKKMYIGQLDEIERFMSFMKFNIEIVHPAEDYDIMYSFGGYARYMNHDFALLLKFRDVSISNSIEMDHHIGDMIVKSTGLHYVSHGRDEFRAIFYGSISGTRLTFTPGDAGKNYQHSHLTTSMHNFGNFCTGSENYANDSGNGNYLTEHSIQEHVFRLETFIKWESLEGGPHYRMENINAHGAIQTIKKNILGTDRDVGNRYIERLIYEINQTPDKFATFAPCFTIISHKGSLKFIADYQMFFRKFMEIIPSDKIKQINAELRMRIYTYNSMEGTFHAVNDMDSVNEAKIIEKAERNMRHFNPIYINGKYHRPHLSTRDVGDLLKGLVFSPEPNIMKEIAQLIMYQLTNKLEQYGNTSTNEGEAS